MSLDISANRMSNTMVAITTPNNEEINILVNSHRVVFLKRMILLIAPPLTYKDIRSKTSNPSLANVMIGASQALTLQETEQKLQNSIPASIEWRRHSLEAINVPADRLQRAKSNS